VHRVIPLYGGGRDILFLSIRERAKPPNGFYLGLVSRASRARSSRITRRIGLGLFDIQRGASHRFTVCVIFVYGDNRDVFISIAFAECESLSLLLSFRSLGEP